MQENKRYLGYEVHVKDISNKTVFLTALESATRVSEVAATVRTGLMKQRDDSLIISVTAGFF